MLSGKADPNIISMSQPMGGDVLEDLDKSGRLSVDEPEMASDLEQMSRKLIHEGQMTIKVRDVVSGRDELESMVDQAGGFVSNVQYNAYAYNRSIEITVRVPTDGFGDFLERVRELGYVESESMNVLDVTDHYVDLERRIQTNEMLAERLEQLIQEKSYQFKDLLEVERELSRLRLENEQLQGSLMSLDNRISLSTLSITLYQDVVQKVVPPDSAFSPLFNAIENAGPRFKGSVRGMMQVFGLCITVVIVLLPWLMPLAVIGAIVWVVFKIRNRRQRKVAGK